MAKQTINQGTAPTGAGGDTFRTGSAKLQANDDEIYNYLGDGTNLNKLGTAALKNTGTQAGNVMEVGAFGLGGDSPNLQGTTFQERLVNKTGIYQTSPNTELGDGVVLFINRGGNYWYKAIAMPVGDAPPEFLTGVGDSSSWSKRGNFIVLNYNAAIDSNGFIKAASPIVKLFANNIELNDEAKQQEITFEKLGVGDYLIKGSTGFAQDGWYVETPKDANGNVLFLVIYTTLENGDISIKTYKKKFDLETASIVADLDKPVDITEGRWIDIRLQALPPVEYEMPMSKTPADFQPTGISQAVSEMMNGTEQ